MPPPVFLSKSAQAIENKGSEWEKKLQESLRVRKLLKAKSRLGGQQSEFFGERVDELVCATVMAQDTRWVN